MNGRDLALGAAGLLAVGSLFRRGSADGSGRYATLDELVRAHTGRLDTVSEIVAPPNRPEIRALFSYRVRGEPPERLWAIVLVREEAGAWIRRGFMQVRGDGEGSRCHRLAFSLAHRLGVPGLRVASVRQVWIDEPLQRGGLGTWLYEETARRVAREGYALGMDTCNEDGHVSGAARATWVRLARRFPSEQEDGRVVVWGGSGSRSVVELASARIRQDDLRYRYYGSLPIQSDDDPILMAGFTDERSAKAWAEEVKRVHRYKPAVLSRDQLRKKNVDTRDIERWWAKGEPVVEVLGEKTPLPVAKAALHNANWWDWGRPFRHMDEAVVTPATHKTAREYAETWNYGDGSVFVFREYGLPDDLSWWQKVERETSRLGLPMRADSINAGVWVLSPQR